MQKLVYCLVLATALLQLLQSSEARNRQRISEVAKSHMGDYKWNFASSHATGSGTNKISIFVTDVLSEAGSYVPHRGLFGGAINAEDWGNSEDTYLVEDECWTTVDVADIGDVIGDGSHVGIVTGERLTTSVSNFEQIVVENNWGFNPRYHYTYWRYICDE